MPHISSKTQTYPQVRTHFGRARSHVEGAHANRRKAQVQNTPHLQKDALHAILDGRDTRPNAHFNVSSDVLGAFVRDEAHRDIIAGFKMLVADDHPLRLRIEKIESPTRRVREPRTKAVAAAPKKSWGSSFFGNDDKDGLAPSFV